MCKNIKLFGPGTGLRGPESPGTKKSQDLTSPKVPGLENQKSPGTMETLLHTYCVHYHYRDHS